ncbi:hypothetical protein FRB90_008390, partial [Tulasnella sp. 427]
MTTPADINTAGEAHRLSVFHGLGTNQIRKLGLYQAGRCRWRTYALRLKHGVDPQFAAAELTVAAVSASLTRKSRNAELTYTILNYEASTSTPSSMFLIVFHSDQAFATAKDMIAENGPPFSSFTLLPLSDFEPAELRCTIDALLGEYLNGVDAPSASQATAHSASQPSTTQTAQGQPEPTPPSVTASSLPPLPPASTLSAAAKPKKRRRRKVVRQTAPSAADLLKVEWQNANLHIRDIIANMSILHPAVLDLLPTLPFLSASWSPSTTGTDPSLQEAISSLVAHLPQDNPDIAAQLKATFAQAAHLCGVPFSLDPKETDGEDEGEEREGQREEAAEREADPEGVVT